mmetsp:Transcript_28040/g.40580  ORF Transcript_28040/g.40580 Transcript_28040/m.40580 type:complete len:128 (-) Transcript_28040:4-387(-)
MLLHARKERNTIQYWADKNGEETKAINLYNIILRSQTAMYGCNGQCAVETKGLMCMIYVELDKFKEAQHCCKIRFITISTISHDDLLSPPPSRLPSHVIQLSIHHDIFKMTTTKTTKKKEKIHQNKK